MKNKLFTQKDSFENRKNYYNTFIDDIPIYSHTHKYSNNIYWCWIQGINNAPNLYKATFNSVKKNCNDHNIIIINQTNLNKYVKFPSYILEKYNTNKFSNTHFSDLLRLELLIKYGGTWIDASVLMTKYDETFFHKDLFFFKTINDKRISGSSWFLTSEKESPVLKTTRDLIYEYWRKENTLCDYFLFHLFFKYGYKKYINDYSKMPNFSNVSPHFLQKNLLNRFNETIYRNIIKRSSIHKLTKKFSPKNDSFVNYIINSYYLS